MHEAVSASAHAPGRVVHGRSAAAWLPCFTVMLLALPACRSQQTGPSPTWQTTLLTGVRVLDDRSELPQLSEQLAVGLELSGQHPDWPIGGELFVLHSADSDDLSPDGNFDANLVEVGLGLRKTFPIDRLRPFVGAGISYLHADVDFRSSGFGTVKDDDDDWGVYVHAGLDLALTDHAVVGLDVRSLTEEFADFGGYNLDSLVYTLRLGWSF